MITDDRKCNPLTGQMARDQEHDQESDDKKESQHRCFGPLIAEFASPVARFTQAVERIESFRFFRRHSCDCGSVDNQPVVDGVDPLDVLDRFLSHLFFKERSDFAFNDNVTLSHLEMHSPVIQMGVVKNGVLNSSGQVRRENSRFHTASVHRLEITGHRSTQKSIRGVFGFGWIKIQQMARCLE